MKIKIIIGLCLGLVLQAFAQPGGRTLPKIGTIIGRVLDAQTEKPVEYASVSILSYRDSSIVGGGVTEPNGYFKIQELPPGRLLVVVNFIGYEDLNHGPVMINRENLEVSLGNLKLKPAVETLDEVVVEEKGPVMEVVLDKKVFDVSQIETAEGGSASEVLQNIPSVEVDIEGNISLRGNQNVRILIDGKPSALAGADPATILQQIPADAIKDIEVITNPSARYDPDGMTGIINIVTKKNKWVGLNGSVTLGGGNFGKNANANISYRDRKVNVFSSFGYRNFTFPFIYASDQETLYDSTYIYLTQKRESERSNDFYNGKLGFDYYLNPYNTITVSAVGNTGNFGGKTEQILTQWTSEGDSSRYTRNTLNDGDRSGYDLNLNYTKTFVEKGREFITDLRFSRGGGLNMDSFEQDYTTQDSTLLQRANSENSEQYFTVQMDYIHPIGENRKWEAGLKLIDQARAEDYDFFDYDSDLNAYTFNSFFSNQYDYTEENWSAYAIYGAEHEAFSYQVGLRAEQTYFDLTTPTIETIERDYFSLFPSAHISKKLNETNELMLSYSRRIDRPSPRQLNPVKDLSDPLNTRSGNPELTPEFIDAVELSLNHSMGKNSLQANLYFRQENDKITRFREVDSLGVSNLTYINLGSAQSYGAELIGSFRFGKWSFLPSANLYQNNLVVSDESQGVNAQNIAFSGKLMATYSPIRSLSFQASSRYRSKRVTTQGTFTPGVGLDLSGSYRFWEGNGSLSLSARNVFNSLRYDIYTVSRGFEQTAYFQRPGPVVFVNFTWRFGKQDFSFKRRSNRGGGSGGDDDMEIM